MYFLNFVNAIGYAHAIVELNFVRNDLLHFSFA